MDDASDDVDVDALVERWEANAPELDGEPHPEAAAPSAEKSAGGADALADEWRARQGFDAPPAAEDKAADEVLRQRFWILRASPRTLRFVRDAVRAQMHRWDAWDEDIDAVVLMADELTANVARHCGDGAPWFLLALEYDGASVWLQVHDGCHGALPAPATVCDDAENGRGLLLVDALSDGGWGVVDSPVMTKAVWARRDLSA